MSTPAQTPGLFVRLQNAFAAFLRDDVASGARAFFTDAVPAIPVLAEESGSLNDAINDGLKRTGMSIVVKAFTADGAMNNVPGKIGYAKVYLAVLVGYTPKRAQGLHGSTIAEKVVWVARKFAFEGKAAQHEGTDTLPPQNDFPDQSFLTVAFTFRDVVNAIEPVRSGPGLGDDDPGALTMSDEDP